MDDSAETPNMTEPNEPSTSNKLGPSDARGPDPVVGAGLALLGILVMGIGGAGNMHYVFNVGTLIAITGAIVFVMNVALSAAKQRSPEQNP